MCGVMYVEFGEHFLKKQTPFLPPFFKKKRDLIIQGDKMFFLKKNEPKPKKNMYRSRSII